MKKAVMVVLAGLVTLANVGCVAAIGNTSRAKIGYMRQAVESGGEIYVVDVNNGTAYRVDKSSALPVSRMEVIVEVDEDDE